MPRDSVGYTTCANDRLWQIVLQKSPWRSCRIKIRNNRIRANGFLNQRCALTPDLESILHARTGKIVLQHNPLLSGNPRLRSSLPSCAISGCDRRGLMLTRKRFQGRSYRRSRRERWPPESIQAFPIESWRPWKSSLSATWLWPRQQPR